ncbi:hypothetical protein [Winogradskyella sp.]|uniref:hypothetical protein n=1 Tax=Winogradskyella sp. TaxID=1883156 RepID=UPI0025E0C374|nr:hypothetical protein [Winogradskyella sp.]
MKFKIQFMVIYSLLFSWVINAQIDTIDLPEGDDDIKINTTTLFFSIYVDNQSNVFLDKDSINVYNIAKRLSYLRYKLPEHFKMRVKINLYVDKKADYYIVDIIKTQLASAYFERLYYKTNSIEDADVLKGISWTNHQSFYHLERPKKILTKKQQEKNRRFNDSINRGFGDIPPPPAPPTSWFFDSQHIIYSDSKDAIEEALEGRTFSCITLTNKGYMKNDKIIKFKNKEKVESLFYSQDIVFVKFSDDLVYGNYLDAIKYYKDLDNKKKGYFIELSSEIEMIHKKSDIQLSN